MIKSTFFLSVPRILAAGDPKHASWVPVTARGHQRLKILLFARRVDPSTVFHIHIHNF